MEKDKLQDKFSELYKNLNPEQKEAVDTIEGPVMVLAGPGTGKTTILTLRVTNILKKTDTPPSGILAITYTDAGVKAMREKLKDIIGAEARNVSIHTFHSFASEMIEEYRDHFLNIHGFRQMTDIEQESLIRNILRDKKFSNLRPLQRPDAYMSQIIRSISSMKKDAYSGSMIREFAEKQIKEIESDEENISTRGATKGTLKAAAREKIEKLNKTILFSFVYDEYEKQKKERKVRDYDDLITELLLALKNDELLLRLIQERFLYIHVDEHQDTNDAQNFIIASIAEFFETPNIFIVGDEKQAIYRFQGASVENFLRLKKQWPDMKVISLNKNYRSHQGILDASFNLIENNYEADDHKDLRVELKSQGNLKSKLIECVEGETVKDIENNLVTSIKNILDSEQGSTIAVITRRNRELHRILSLVELHGIEASSERSIDIFHHPVGNLFFDLLEFTLDPSRIDLLAKTVTAGLWGLSFSESISLIHKIKTLGTKDTNEIDNLIPALKSIKEEVLTLGPVNSIISIAELSEFFSILNRDISYVSIWRGILSLSESLVQANNLSDAKSLISTLLEYRLSAETKHIKIVTGVSNARVKVLTAHGSKGLEFDYVYIPYATEEKWLGRAHGVSFILPGQSEDREEVRDTRRLFFVALTRAKKHATILYSLQESDGSLEAPIRFIEELGTFAVRTKLDSEVLDKNKVKGLSFGRNGEEGSRVDIELHKKTKIENRNKQFIEEAKRVLTESGLSVTSLNNFLSCPSKFLYENILKIPQAPSLSATKGVAMHEAISQLWKSEAEVDAVKIEEYIKKVAIKCVDSSYLGFVDKELLKSEILADASTVAKGLEYHFKIKGEKMVEKWVGGEFGHEFLHDGQKINVKIPITGKLDLLVNSNPEFHVYDYKTKQAETLAAIKGETKSSDGRYFRQLIFYKLLLERDEKFKARNVKTSLVYISPDSKGACPTVDVEVSELDIERVKTEIQKLIEAVWTGSIMNSFCSDTDCEYCGFERNGLFN